MLNEDGGIETDVTITCLKKNHFRVIGPAATREHDKFHIKKHISQEVNLKDVTEDLTCLGLYGPNSRKLLSNISNDDFSNEGMKFSHGKLVTIDGISVWAQRLSYVGEIGFELYANIEESKKLFLAIVKEGKNHGLSLCGAHAMDIMRMESGFLHWGHDISPEENQYQAGLQFAISYKKNINFVGKDALLKIKDQNPTKSLAMMILKDNRPGEPLLLHEEPIYLDDKIIGRTTSGNYSFNFNKNISFGYVNSGNTIDNLINKNLSIEVEKKKYPVTIIEKPLNQKNIKNI
jgi:4-methylaminobutanoate oxidase (formaldehyde-forming)